MSSLITALIFATGLAAQPQAQPPSTEAANRVAAMTRFDVEVLYWQGSFGTYMRGEVGSTVHLNLAAVGTNELLLSSRTDKDGNKLGWYLKELRVDSDVTQPTEYGGWVRRVILKTPQTEGAKLARRTILELVVQYEVDFSKEEDGRRVQYTSDTTHYSLTLHTVAADETVPEFARAIRSFPRQKNPREKSQKEK